MQKKAEEKELQRAVKGEEDGGFCSLESNNRAIKKQELQRAVKAEDDSLGTWNLTLPKEFMCPPTYDRPFIGKWFKDGNQIFVEHKHYLNLLLKKLLSASISDKKDAAKELRRLTKQIPSVRPLFRGIPDSISQLLCPLYLLATNSPHPHPDLRDDLLTTIFYISIHDDGNKKLVAENSLAFSFLAEFLNSGNVETKKNAAASFLTLSYLDSNKHKIGKSWALKLLINLLDKGHPLASKHAAQAVFTISSVNENKGRAVSEGAVRVIMKKIKERVLVDELLSTLARLSSHHKAIKEMRELGAMSCLLTILTENTSEHNNRNCIARNDVCTMLC